MSIGTAYEKVGVSHIKCPSKSGFTHTYLAHFLTQTWALRDTPTRPHDFLTHTWAPFSGDWARSGTLWRFDCSLVKLINFYIAPPIES